MELIKFLTIQFQIICLNIFNISSKVISRSALIDFQLLSTIVLITFIARCFKYQIKNFKKVFYYKF